MNDPVEVARCDGVAEIMLNRPDRGNALSARMVEAMLAAIEEIGGDSGLHTLVLRGAGKHLCTGLDLSDLETETDASLLRRAIRIEQLLDAVWRAPLRTLAVGKGRVTGAGADLFAACDRRVLENGATLQFPGAGFGLVLGTRRLAVRVGPDRALNLVSSGRRVDQEEALAIGLATEVRAPDDWTAPPPRVTRETFAALRGALDDDGSDADLAALVRSAARPGLHDRITAYVAAGAARGAGGSTASANNRTERDSPNRL